MAKRWEILQIKVSERQINTRPITVSYRVIEKDGLNWTVNGASTHARQLVAVFQVLCSLYGFTCVGYAQNSLEFVSRSLLIYAKNLALHSSHFALNWRCCTVIKNASTLAMVIKTLNLLFQMLCRLFIYHLQFRKYRRTKLSPSFWITLYYHVPIDPASVSASSVVGMQVCLTSQNIPLSITAMKYELFDKET